MAALHGSADMIDEEEHENKTFAQEFIELDDWHEVATDRNYQENIVTFSEHKELPL